MNVIEKFEEMAHGVNGKSIHELSFHEHQMDTFRYAEHPPYMCISCGRAMTANQQQPPGKMTKRAMHDACFNYLIQQCYRPGKHGVCVVCGYEIKNVEQQRGQATMQLDIHHWVHQEPAFRGWRPCIEYFVLASIHGLAIRTGIYESEVWWNMRENALRKHERTSPHPQQRQRIIPQQPVPRDDGIYEAEWRNVTPRGLPHPPQRALPPPNDDLKIRFEPNNEKETVFVPIREWAKKD